MYGRQAPVRQVSPGEASQAPGASQSLACGAGARGRWSPIRSARMELGAWPEICPGDMSVKGFLTSRSRKEGAGGPGGMPRRLCSWSWGAEVPGLPGDRPRAGASVSPPGRCPFLQTDVEFMPSEVQPFQGGVPQVFMNSRARRPPPQSHPPFIPVPLAPIPALALHLSLSPLSCLNQISYPQRRGPWGHRGHSAELRASQAGAQGRGQSNKP